MPNSDKCEIYTYMAGGGCTLPGKAMVLMPGEGYEGVTKFVMDVMTTYGLNACPPLLVGVGVATSVETAALYQRKHSCVQSDLTMRTREPQRWKNFSRMVSMLSALDLREWAENTQ
mgnify:CR=1 FL=1